MMRIEHNIQTCGLATKLTNSQTDNSKIIQSLWINFNCELKKYGITQKGGNWTKFGITYKIEDNYFYLAAILSQNQTFPDKFICFEIPKGEYKVFTHKGKMEDIKQTLFEIYKVILPKSNLNIENDKQTGFIHFEKYDYRFQWNKPNSEIDIYLPLKNE